MGNKEDMINENDNKIRFFISSTFGGMTEERETIQKEVYPELREYGLKKGIYVDVCDLRWGLVQDPEKLSDNLVNIMVACFREIDDCRPYFFAMIKKNYGTKIIKKTIKKIIQTREVTKNFMKNRYKGHESLTHLEMIYSGMVNSKDNDQFPMHYYSCFYTEDREKETKKIVEEIISNNNEAEKKGTKDKIVFTYEYKSIDDFKNAFIVRGCSLIDEKAKSIENSNKIEIEFRHAEAYTREKCKLFAGREEILKEIKNNIRKYMAVRIYGVSGIGKTTIMSRLFNENDYDNEKKIFIAGGVGEESGQYINILHQMIYFLEKKIKKRGLPEVRTDLIKEEDGEKEIIKLLKDYNKIKNAETIYIFLDAVDKIECIDAFNIIEILTDPGNKKVKCVYSEKIDKPIADRETDNYKDVKIDILSPEDVNKVISRKIYPSEKETISDKVTQELMKKGGEIFSPLYIDSAAYILKSSIDKIDNIKYREEFFINMIRNMPPEYTKLCWQTIKNAGVEHFRGIWKDIIGLIGFSNKGMREKDLSSILGEKWKTMNFVVFRQNLFFIFRSDPGFFWRFEHDLIKGSLRKKLDNKKKIYYEYITEYLLNKADTEMLYREGWRLCVENMEGESIDRLEKKLIDTSLSLDNSSTELLFFVKELHDVMDDTDEKLFDSWFTMLSERYGVLVIKFLDHILREEQGNDSYERRYPAVRITDRFWKIIRQKYSSLDDWDRKNGGTESRLFMSYLCVDYISACEVFGRGKDALYYTEYPIKRLTELQKELSKHGRRIMESLNSVLYCNNKVMNQIIGYSKHIVDTYDKEPRHPTIYPDDIAYKYESDIGQYYNGIKNYAIAITWHEKSMIKRINVLEKMLMNGRTGAVVKTNELKKQLEDVFKMINVYIFDRNDTAVLEEADTEDTDKMIIENEKKQKDLLDKIIGEISSISGEKSKKARDGHKYMIMRLAVGYRTIGTDAYHIVDNMESKDSGLEILVRIPAFMMALSKHIFENDFIKNDYKRDVMTTQLRWIGNIILKEKKGKKISRDEKNELIKTFNDAAGEYINNIKRYKENKSFYNDLKKFSLWLMETSDDEEEKTELNKLIDKLEKINL